MNCWLRGLGLALLAVLLFPSAQAQSPLTRAFADPAVWASVSSGVFASAYGPGDRDNVMHDFSVSAASPRWTVRGGAQISGYFDPVFGADDPFVQLSEEKDVAPITFRSLYALGGPYATSRWFMAGASIGPAVTWGTRARFLPNACNGMPFCTFELQIERERYINPGLAASVQGFVRLDGRVWVGGETMAIGNVGSSHLATRLALRVDLLRPSR